MKLRHTNHVLCIHYDIDAILVFGSDGRNGQDRQYLKHVPSAAPLTLGEHLEPNSQMELVGHSIVRHLSLSHTHTHTHKRMHTFTYISKHSWTCINMHPSMYFGSQPTIFVFFKCLWDCMESLFDCGRNLALNFSGIDIISLFRSAVWWNTDFIWATNDGMLWMYCSMINWITGKDYLVIIILQ